MNARTIWSLFKVQKSHLGRWTVHNTRETDLKIKYANEDNCGISGYKARKEESYIYMMSIHK